MLRQSFESGPPPTRAWSLELPLHSSKVVLLRGIRRSGKTSLFYHTMRRLEASGVARQQVVYLNLEDDRLYPIAAVELDLVLQAQAELFPMQAFTAQPDRDFGRKLENLVFLKRRALGGELFYHADGFEVDLVHRSESERVFTNVCWTLDSLDTARREVTGLIKARDQYPEARLELVANEFGSQRIPRFIQKFAAWRYLLA